MVGGHRVRLVGGGILRRFGPWAGVAVAVVVAVLTVTWIKMGTSGGRSVVVEGPTGTHHADVDTPPTSGSGDPLLGAPSADSVPTGTAASSPVGTAPASPATTKATTKATTNTPPRPPAPPVVTSYEAESPANGLAGTREFTCDGCSGGKKIGNIGRGMGSLQFNGVDATSGPITVTLVYVNGENTRSAELSVDGGTPVTLNFPGTGGWSTVGALDVTVTARAGANTVRLFNTVGPAPDFDKIIVTVPGR